MGVINQSRYYCIIVPQPTAPISIMICKLGEFQVGPTFDDNEITCALHFQFDSKNSILEQQQHLEAGNSRNDKINKMHVRTSACSIRSPPGDEKLKVGRKLCK